MRGSTLISILTSEQEVSGIFLLPFSAVHVQMVQVWSQQLSSLEYKMEFI